MDILTEGKKVFDIEINALEKTKNSLDNIFVQIFEKIHTCSGKVIFTGIGKPGHIAAKLAATFASLGIPSFYLHPAEAMHGDLGMVSENDIVIAISYSGESDEIIRILPNIQMIGATIIGITGNANSTLTRLSDISQVLPGFEEACALGLAPTSSTTAVLCYGDALAVTASKASGFTESDFARFHPAGALGKRLILKVKDLMAKERDMPYVMEDTLLMDAIAVMSKKGLGVVSVVDENMKLLGIITDGDLRRIIEKRIDLYSVKVAEVMTVTPKIFKPERLAVDALRFIKQNQINNLPVVNEQNILCGTITWQMIIRAGIVV
ncbi:MAG: KpsF/GutQ family sugar-phosphate isomerase [Lachnospiraceae bacterium]|nr:KpsF/GutQ family sugar-phosphate isomerase [Lachnospiraceae bacterium]